MNPDKGGALPADMPPQWRRPTSRKTRGIWDGEGKYDDTIRLALDLHLGIAGMRARDRPLRGSVTACQFRAIAIGDNRSHASTAHRGVQPASNSNTQTTATPRVSIPPPRRFRSISQSDVSAPAPAPIRRRPWSLPRATWRSSSSPRRLNRTTFASRSTSPPPCGSPTPGPLIVAAAQASVWVAEAQLTRAKVLWVPTLNIGFDYIRHDGGGPDFNKGIMTAPSVNFFYGGGGLVGNVATTDAIFQPLAARQVLNARQWDIQTAKNDALLETADAYFSVHQYRGMYAGTLYAVERGHDLVERITKLSKDLVPKVEVDRARNLLADLEQQADLRAGSSGASTAPTSRRCSGSTPARWSCRWSTTTSRSR